MKAYFFVNNENTSYFYIYIRVNTFALSGFYSFFFFFIYLFPLIYSTNNQSHTLYIDDKI